MNKTNDIDILHHIMASALLDIRIAAHEENSKAAFALSDLLHTLPYQLLAIAQGTMDATTVLHEFKQRCQTKQLSDWCDNAINDYLTNDG